MRFILCPPRGERLRHLINVDQHTRLEGRQVDGQYVLFAYDLNDVDKRDYSRVFQHPDGTRAAWVFDQLVAFLGNPDPTSLVFDVVAVNATYPG